MTVRILIGDCRDRLRELPSESVHCVVTSPPYWGLRDYGVAGQIGLEDNPSVFIDELTSVFSECRRILRQDGTLWLNIGDAYAGSGRGGNPTEETSTLQGGHASQRASMVKRSRTPLEVGRTSRDAAVTNVGRRASRGSQLPAGFHENTRQNGAIGRAWVPPPFGWKQKDLMGMPWRVAFALQAAGWWLRQDIIWAKPNPMPESIRDRCTKAHEYLFLLAKSEHYYYDAEAIAEAAEKAGQVLHTYGTGAKDRQDVSAVNDRRTRIGLADWDQACPETRNKRSVWSVATTPFGEAHFATFPPALIEPCIAAGSSARGCCPSCGAGWRRLTAKVPTGKQHKMPDGMATYAGSHSAIHRDGREPGTGGNPVMASVTLGWYPACDCGALPPLPNYPEKPSRVRLGDEALYKAAMSEWLVECSAIDIARKRLCDDIAAMETDPATVLDPFGGAGTSGLVADRLQRNAVLIELNPEYAAMAERRIRKECGMFSDVRLEELAPDSMDAEAAKGA